MYTFSWSSILGALFSLIAVLTTTAAGAAPPAEAPDLAWGTAAGELTWHYINPGDYNQDSLITVSDLTPYATLMSTFYNLRSPGFPAPFAIDSVESVVDGNNNGMVEIADITTLGQNFDKGIQEYRIYTGAAGDWPDNGTLLDTVDFSLATGDHTAERLAYAYQLAAPADGTYYWAVPFHREIAGTASPALLYTATAPADAG